MTGSYGSNLSATGGPGMTAMTGMEQKDEKASVERMHLILQQMNGNAQKLEDIEKEKKCMQMQENAAQYYEKDLKLSQLNLPELPETFNVKATDINKEKHQNHRIGNAYETQNEGLRSAVLLCAWVVESIHHWAGVFVFCCM